MDQTNTQPIEKWSFIKKIVFRFFIILCVFLIVPILSDVLWPQLIKWSGNYFFNEAVTSHPSGSGDTLYDFYNISIKIIIAAIITIVWSVADRKRKSYNTLLYWQEVYIRYYLAFFLIVYGLMKVIKLQFGQPGLSQLLIPLGQKSPMGLAWTFIGYSDTYTIFSGICEVSAAFFLVYRKTRTLGALLSFGVMLNVFLMNMSYDIPVKLFSLQLLLLSLFLIGLDYKRLISVFILNKPAEPQKCSDPFREKWANTTTQIIKAIAILGGLGFTLNNNIKSMSLYGDAAPKSAMYGIYEVDTFIKNNDTIAPIITDTTRWHYLVIDGEYANIFNMKTKSYNDVVYYQTKIDTLKREVLFINYSDSTEVAKLRYIKTDKNHYMYKGVFKKDSIELHTVRTDEKDYPLMNRGFRWVNEYPYNR